MKNPQDNGVILFRNVERASKIHGKTASERLALYEKARAEFNPQAQKILGVHSVNSNGELQGSNVFARALIGRMSSKGTRLGNLYDFLKVSENHQLICLEPMKMTMRSF